MAEIRVGAELRRGRLGTVNRTETGKDQREEKQTVKRKEEEWLMKPNCVSHKHTFTITEGRQDEKTRGAEGPRESNESKEKPINVARIAFIFTFTMTFTSCCSRPESV